MSFDRRALYLSCVLASSSLTTACRSEGPLEPVPTAKLPEIGYVGTWQETHVLPDGSTVKGESTWRVAVHGKRFHVERIRGQFRDHEVFVGGERILTFDGGYQSRADEENLQKTRFWAKQPTSKKVGGQVICDVATREFDLGHGLKASLHYEHDIVLRREDWISQPGSASKFFAQKGKYDAGDHSGLTKRIVECTSLKWIVPDESEFKVPNRK